jgi:ketosteroid isomerase-like protein
VSRENVELVMSLQPATSADMVKLFRDDFTWASAAAALTPLLDPDFEVIAVDGIRDKTVYRGIDGLRSGWLDWLSPWVSYKAEVEDAIDVGDKVLLLVRDVGRLEADGYDVAINSAAVWTVRDGTIVRAEFHSDRAVALKAVGLEE